MPTKLIGTEPYQVPRNADLGTLAFQDANAFRVEGGYVATKDTLTTGLHQDTEVTDIRPSLLLDFANSKALDPRVTFSRASTATYYDGTTTAKAEENLILQSEAIGNSPWRLSNNSLIANSTVAPNGTFTADTIVQSSNGTSKLEQDIQSNVFWATGQTYALSVYVKTVNATHVFLGPNTWDGAGAAIVEFSVSGTPAVSRTSAAGGWVINNTSVTAVGNGWHRLGMVFTVGTTSTTYLHRIHIGFGDGSSTIASDAQILISTGTGNMFHIWGAQLEIRNTITGYTPTTTQQVVRYQPVLRTAAAGAPRFDHNPITSESLGLLVEGQRTNLMIASADLTNAGGWTTPGTTIIRANQAVAPDGTLSAELLTSSSTMSFAGIYKVGGGSKTLSLFVKAAGAKYFAFIDVGGNGISSVFNLEAGTIVSVTSGYTAAMTNVGNGWYRCSVSHANSFAYWQIGIVDGLNTTFFTGDSFNGIYIWGAQGEDAPFASSYIPTTNSQVTRSADSAEITGQNFLNFFNQTSGTGCFEGSLIGRQAALQGGFAFTRNSGNNNVLDLRVQQAGFGSLHVTYGYGAQQSLIFNNVDMPINTTSKFAIAYETNNIAFYKDSILVGTDSLVAIPSDFTKLEIGRADNDPNKVLNGYVKRFVYYPKRLSNAELQEITLP